MKRRLFLAVISAALAGGCGFKLRRFDGMPFASLYIDAPRGGAVAQRVRTVLAADSQLRLTAAPAEAEAVLQLGPENRTRVILSLSGAGRVTEYRLGLDIRYGILGGDGSVLTAPETIELIHDITYDDAQILAKDAEEQLLYRDMENSAAQRILRRLQAINPGATR